MNDVISQLFHSVMTGNAGDVKIHVQSALDADMDPTQILNEGMIAAMREVGRLFETGEYFVPEMLIAARSMQTGMAILKPHLLGSEVQSAGKVVIGTVKGDLHDIGKNLVALMLEGAGFEIRDLGTDVPAEDFVAAIKSEPADILALSALLTTTMPSMKVTIEAIQHAGLRNAIKVLVGGAPVTEEYAHQIGADGYAPDASRAVTVAHALLNNH